jgi:D-glycero-D-manno-heptose 1,7-bisphosphate phosphatase
MKERAVFLDRDGTLIEDKDYLHLPEEVAFFPGAIAALRQLQHAGFQLVMVTNQSGIGRGYFTLDDVHRVHDHMASELEKHGVRIAQTFIAPEHPDAPSRGRKPSPQFLFDARDQLNLDLGASYMVGDKLIDLECGWNAGVRKALLVRTGYGTEVERSAPACLTKAMVVDGLKQAADWIINDCRS